MLRALSILQPWASLLAIGAKQWETRSWPTAYTGRFAIHASKSLLQEQKALCVEEPFRYVLDLAGLNPCNLPLGAIIAVATITDCKPTEAFHRTRYTRRSDRNDFVEISSEEFRFGNFLPHRYAFRVENVIQLPQPVACRGSLSFWSVPQDVADAVRAQLPYDCRSEVA